MTEATGIIGERYTTETGMKLAPLWPDRESDEAWEQVSATRRVRVRAKRIGHATCLWEVAAEIDLPPGMAR